MQQLQQKGKKSRTAFNVSVQIINLPLSVLNSYASCHSKNPSSLAHIFTCGQQQMWQTWQTWLNNTLFQCVWVLLQKRMLLMHDAFALAIFFHGPMVNWFNEMTPWKTNPQKNFTREYLFSTLTCRNGSPSSHQTIRCSPRKGECAVKGRSVTCSLLLLEVYEVKLHPQQKNTSNRAGTE